MTPASLTTLCGELLAQNILFELGEVQQEDKRAGRRKILLGINYAYRHVLSISIEAPATSVTLCDLLSLIHISMIRVNRRVAKLNEQQEAQMAAEHAKMENA